MNCFLCKIKISNLKLKKIVNIYMNRIAYKSVQKLNISTACAATYTFYIHVSVAWYFKFLFNKSNLQLACNYPPFLENKT